MSRATPRKHRPRRQPSSSGGPHMLPASDYESDAQHYMETREIPPAPHQPHRTNTELNLTVLRRYLPSIRSIFSIAANAVVYTFAHAEKEWEKSGVEGTLFVCEQEPAQVSWDLLPRACVFILNRRGLENVIVDLAKVSNCELAGEFLMFQLDDSVNPGDREGADAGGSGTPAPNILSLWIHAAEQDDTRDINATIIKDLWRRVRLKAESVKVRDQFSPGSVLLDIPRESLGPAMQAMGRRLSLSDLFGQKKDG